MSGFRHHFIPKFLQKSFSSRTTNTDVYCWVFSKNAKTFQPNIKNVGVETLFYSTSSEAELDDKISKEEEGNFSPLVDRLRASSICEEDTAKISAMLAHFEIRSQHFRSNANILISELIDTLLETFSNLNSLQDFLGKIISPNSPVFQRALLEAGISKKLFKQITESNPAGFRELKASIARGVSNTIYERRDAMPALIAKAIKNAHIKTLNESISPPKKASRYSNLKYTVQSYSTDDLPLGDSIILFHVAGDRKFKPFLDKSDELIAVILPLSPSQYLIGSSCELDVAKYSDLAVEVARCSFDYFITNKNAERTKDYQSEIGTNSHWLSAQDVHKIFAESLDEILEGC
ncbi:Protein of unknown function [Pseudomonas sp. NFACC15-1]|uniref:DUF4238 domain-containing protein n=1 Tax=unclassified Pseudomonas TaxID=196821 RepID=UPI00087ED7F7|nr:MULTISPECIES: DUF4238 domain-containing protein [unclassified Pseudomonas]SDA63488.1 Protein of unknown function [Pseudomonas sp. NFACC15-1]SDX91852.1 Protein of unknown function [Pseudomonas sp. NFACC14]